MSDLVLNLTADVISAHVANNTVAAEDLPKLIQNVHRALANAGQAATTAPQAEPAVALLQTTGHSIERAEED